RCSRAPPYLHSFPTRRSSDLLRRAVPPAAADAVRRCRQERLPHRELRRLGRPRQPLTAQAKALASKNGPVAQGRHRAVLLFWTRSEEHTSELQSRFDLVCRLL